MEPSELGGLERSMSDSSGQTNFRKRSRPLTIGLILVVAIITGIGGFAAWRNNLSAKETLAHAAPVPVSNQSPVVAAIPDPSLNDLRESVAAIQSTQKQILDEIGNIKQRIAAEQGERKLLTAQLGSLSLRLDELSAASASMTEGASAGQSQKKRAKSR